MLAELAICNPWLSLFIFLERERINQYCLAIHKLNIVCAGILQCHVVFQCSLVNSQSRESSILQLAKCPLIWIRNERYALRLDNFECIRASTTFLTTLATPLSAKRINLSMWNQQ